MANQYDAIHSLDDHAVVVIVDADDRLTHDRVLAYINDVYQNPNVWMTYGQFRNYGRGTRGFCHAMPHDVIEDNSFRSYSDIPSHLRTFYAGLFKNIRVENLMYDGKFLTMCADIAAMMPMIEMARNGHFTFLPDVLLDYNDVNTINDHKVSKNFQRKMDLYVRSLPKYQPLETPFN